MEPGPRGFTSLVFVPLNALESLRELIQTRINNSSMPAWHHVLKDEQDDDIIPYSQLSSSAI